MQEISTCILVITLASLMAFDTDGIGRTYVQLKNAGNSFSLNCKYFLLELSGGGREPRIVSMLSSISHSFLKLYIVCLFVSHYIKINKILNTKNLCEIPKSMMRQNKSVVPAFGAHEICFYFASCYKFLC